MTQGGPPPPSEALWCRQSLAHAVRVLSPGVVAVQHAVHPISEAAIELDRAEVLRADLEPDRRDSALPAGGLRGLHELRSGATATDVGSDCDGQDATHPSLEQQHHCRRD